MKKISSQKQESCSKQNWLKAQKNTRQSSSARHHLEAQEAPVQLPHWDEAAVQKGLTPPTVTGE